VRAQHHAWQAWTLAFVTTADISDRIEMCAHSGIAHPAQKEVGGCTMFPAEEHAGETPGRFGNRCELVDPADDLIAEG
jgi:hypothetical protein